MPCVSHISRKRLPSLSTWWRQADSWGFMAAATASGLARRIPLSSNVSLMAHIRNPISAGSWPGFERRIGARAAPSGMREFDLESYRISINQSINQSINHSINRTINHLHACLQNGFPFERKIIWMNHTAWKARAELHAIHFTRWIVYRMNEKGKVMLPGKTFFLANEPWDPRCKLHPIKQSTAGVKDQMVAVNIRKAHLQ